MEYALWVGGSESSEISYYKKYPITRLDDGNLRIKLNGGRNYEFYQNDARFKLVAEFDTKLDQEVYELQLIGYRRG